MPDAAEVVALVLELLHLDHLGEAIDAAHERVFDRLAHAPGERHELRRLQGLVAEEDNLIFQECLAYFTNGARAQVLVQLNPEDLGAERARDAADLYGSTLMFWFLMIEP
jgi:hypothetical protein